MPLGHRSTEILHGLGLSEGQLHGIREGEISWDVIEADFGGETAFELILFHGEGQSTGAFMSLDQAEQLSNAWDYERRCRGEVDHSTAFPPGGYDDWAGVRPDSNWRDLVGAYRDAASELATLRQRDMAEPWLFLCRHTLELQLKAIIMLGQQSLGLDADLPVHHDLQKLWTTAYPMAALQQTHDKDRASAVRELVREYHRVDPLSMAFRYPVSRSNAPVEHAPFLHQFSREKHVEVFEQACEYLGKIVDGLSLRITLKEIFNDERS